jgi:hypothetical protein
MFSREALLTHLIEATIPSQIAEEKLKQFGWDADAAKALLTRVNIRHVLSLYLEGKMTSAQLESWANAIECRDDIGFEAGYENVLSEAIHQLANPLLTMAITAENIRELADHLGV